MSKPTLKVTEVLVLSCAAVGGLFGAWLGGSMVDPSNRVLRRVASIAGALIAGLLLAALAFALAEIVRHYRGRRDPS